ncbi:hypothetical protein J4211_01430 [Candidatus Woesearchaeota archaeon]|nr:hypothetical protein [uncultured archaeon]AQS33868.1 hypothetical protein [uncultured archaeon]MBS3124898.1 hypothetical protein [Candidatus Woesearchaeota archaeon]
MTLSKETKEYVAGIALPHFVNTRPVATISGMPIDATKALTANILAGGNTLLAGNAGIGKTQFMWDVIQTMVGEENSLQIREELHRGDIKGLFRYLDKSAYDASGRSDDAVKSKNIDRVLFGIEEITRSGPLQNSLFAIADGEIYDDATGRFYRLGKPVGESGKYHICVATGNIGNGDFAFAGQVDDALATRFHLFLDIDDCPRTISDDTAIYNQKRGPRVAFGKSLSSEEQQSRLVLLLKAHQEIAGLRSEPDMLEDAILKYFSFGLDHCQTNKGGEYALVQHSKRAMKHAWPAMCKTCPSYEKLKFSCGAVRPAEPRHVNSWLRLRNALEATAESAGATVNSEDRIPNLLETIKLAAPYTMKWNSDLIKSDACMQNPGNAARGMVKTFADEWAGLRDDFVLESALAAQGKLYNMDERTKLGLGPVTARTKLLPMIDGSEKRKIFGYFREVLDDYNRKQGTQ